MTENFIPKIWPEDKAPYDVAVAYRLCEVCSDKSRIIWGEGNPKAPIFIILDNPGAREDKDGKEYLCGTRHTLQEAIYRVGLKASDIYLTYLLKCRPLTKYHKEKARSFSLPFLKDQIEAARPKLTVCLGDVVVQTMFSDSGLHVKELRGSVQTLMDLPCIVSYHPLAVRRRPNLLPYFLDDWKMVANSLQ